MGSKFLLLVVLSAVTQSSASWLGHGFVNRLQPGSGQGGGDPRASIVPRASLVAPTFGATEVFTVSTVTPSMFSSLSTCTDNAKASRIIAAQTSFPSIESATLFDLSNRSSSGMGISASSLRTSTHSNFQNVTTSVSILSNGSSAITVSAGTSTDIMTGNSPMTLGTVQNQCTQTVIVVDIITVHAYASQSCLGTPTQPSDASVIYPMTSLPALKSGTTAAASASVRRTLSSCSELPSTSSEAGLTTANSNFNDPVSMQTRPSDTVAVMSTNQGVSATESDIVGHSGTTGTPALPTPESYTLEALTSPLISSETSKVHSPTDVSAGSLSTEAGTTAETSSSEQLPRTTVLTSLPQLSSQSQMSIMSSMLEGTAGLASPSLSSSQPTATQAGSGSCTSVAPGTKPSPAYRDPQSGLSYRIQCGTTLDLVQQCPYLCSQGGGGLFRQCEQSDETNTEPQQGGAPTICQRCLQPCGASKRDVSSKQGPAMVALSKAGKDGERKYHGTTTAIVTRTQEIPDRLGFSLDNVDEGEGSGRTSKHAAFANIERLRDYFGSFEQDGLIDGHAEGSAVKREAKVVTLRRPNSGPTA